MSSTNAHDELHAVPGAGNRNLVAERPTLQTRGAASLRRYPTEFIATLRIVATSASAEVTDKVAQAQRSVVARTNAALSALGAGADEVTVEALPVVGDGAGGRSGRRAQALVSVATERAIDDRVRLARLAQAVTQALRPIDGDWTGERDVFVFANTQSVRFRQTRAEDINGELRLLALKVARDRALAEAAAVGMRVVRMLCMSDASARPAVHVYRGEDMAAAAAPDEPAEPAEPDVALQAEIFNDAVLCTWEIA